MKTKIMNFALVVIFAIVSITAITNIKIAKADSTTTDGLRPIANLTEEEYPFTNNDVVNGVNINDYTYGHNCEVTLTNGVAMLVKGNDDISKIIPNELFNVEGKTFHVGKEWGFFVDTFKVTETDDDLISTVILINVTRNDDLTFGAIADHLQFKFDVIFQGDFVRVSSTDTQTYTVPNKRNAFFNDNYQYNTYLTFETEGDFIVPVPSLAKQLEMNDDGEYVETDITIAEIKQHKKYYFTDMAAKTSLYNVNDLNYGDVGYVEENDYGNFFSQTEYEYRGNFLQEGSINFNETAQIAWDMAMVANDISGEVISGVLGGVLEHLPVADTIVTVFEIGNAISNLQATLMDGNVSSERKLSYTAFYNSREKQLANGGLQKTAVIAVQGNTDQLMIGTGDYFTYDYQVNVPDISIDTRYAAQFTFNLMQVIGETNSTTVFGDMHTYTSSFCNDIYNYTSQGYKEIPVHTVANGGMNYEAHVLPNYYNLMQITPSINGYYSFSISNNQYANFQVIEANVINGQADYTNLNNVIASSTNVNSTAQVSDIYLNDDKAYFIKTEFKEKLSADNIIGRWGQFSLDIRVSRIELSLGSNAVAFDAFSGDSDNVEYVSFTADKNRDYVFTADTAATITEVNSDYAAVGNGSQGELTKSLAIGQSVILKIEYAGESLDVNVKSQKTVHFDTLGGSEISSVVLTNDEPFEMPESPTRDGASFVGWSVIVDGQAVPATASYVDEVDQNEVCLIADWDIITYTITFVTNGGTAVDSINYTVESQMVLPTTERTGYKFIGWYDNEQLTGDPISYILPGELGDKEFYAKFAKETSAITFRGITDITGAQAVMLTYNGNTVQLSGNGEYVLNFDYEGTYTLPTLSSHGFAFDGWTDGTNLYITNGAIVSLFENDTVLTPVWAPVEIKLIVEWCDSNGENTQWYFNQNGNEYGVGESDATVYYSYSFSPNDVINNIRLTQSGSNKLFYRQGYMYKYLVDSEGRYFSWGNFTFYAGINEITAQLYYEKEKYDITFLYDNNTVVENNQEYNSIVPYPNICKAGYTYSWKKALQGINSFEEFPYAYIPDLTPDEESNGGITLQSFESLINYLIVYDLGNAVGAGINGIAPGTFNVETVTELPNENQVFASYHNFTGWKYNDEILNTLGGTTENLHYDENTNSIKLVAQWTAKKYRIDYKYGSEQYSSDEYSYGEVKELLVPSFYGKRFLGWCKSANLSDSPIYTLPVETNGDIVLYAKTERTLFFFYFYDGSNLVSYQEKETGQLVSIPNISKPYYSMKWTSGIGEFYAGQSFSCYGVDATFHASWWVTSSSIVINQYSRGEEYRITDDGGIADQPVDWIALSVGNNELAAYTRIRISITFYAKRDNAGNQYAYLYRGDEVLLAETGNMDLSTAGTQKTLNYEGLAADFLNKGIYVGYTASGTFEDDWLNWSFNCTVTLFY